MQVHVSWLEGGTAIFAFRGTASTQDGLQDVKIVSRNIDYLRELYPGVKAHMGEQTQLPSRGTSYEGFQGLRTCNSPLGRSNRSLPAGVLNPLG